VYGDTIPNYKFLNSLRYSDYALGIFFEQAKKEKYFDNTIFVIVADHVEGFGEKNMYERFHIPCLFYSSKNISPQKVVSTQNQLDILPTILDMLNLNVVHSSFGNSSIKNEELGMRNENKIRNDFAFLPNGNTFGWVENSLFLIANTERNIGLYNFRNDVALKNNLLKEKQTESETLRAQLLSFIQAGRNILKENKLYRR